MVVSDDRERRSGPRRRTTRPPCCGSSRRREARRQPRGWAAGASPTPGSARAPSGDTRCCGAASGAAAETCALGIDGVAAGVKPGVDSLFGVDAIGSVPGVGIASSSNPRGKSVRRPWRALGGSSSRGPESCSCRASAFAKTLRVGSWGNWSWADAPAGRRSVGSICDAVAPGCLGPCARGSGTGSASRSPSRRMRS